MTNAVMAPIIMGGVRNIEVAHEFAKITQGSLGEEVPMICHEHKAMEKNSIGIDRLGENFQEFIPIRIILENSFSLIPAVGDMVQSAGILNA